MNTILIACFFIILIQSKLIYYYVWARSKNASGKAFIDAFRFNETTTVKIIASNRVYLPQGGIEPHHCKTFNGYLVCGGLVGFTNNSPDLFIFDLANKMSPNLLLQQKMNSYSAVDEMKPISGTQFLISDMSSLSADEGAFSVVDISPASQGTIYQTSYPDSGNRGFITNDKPFVPHGFDFSGGVLVESDFIKAHQLLAADTKNLWGQTIRFFSYDNARLTGGFYVNSDSKNYFKLLDEVFVPMCGGMDVKFHPVYLQEIAIVTCFAAQTILVLRRTDPAVQKWSIIQTYALTNQNPQLIRYHIEASGVTDFLISTISPNDPTKNGILMLKYNRTTNKLVYTDFVSFGYGSHSFFVQDQYVIVCNYFLQGPSLLSGYRYDGRLWGTRLGDGKFVGSPFLIKDYGKSGEWPHGLAYSF